MSSEKIEQIKKAGYYVTGLSLSLEDVAALSKFATDWHSYILKIDNKEEYDVTAKDEWTAIEAFKSLYDLNKCEYEIFVVTLTRCRIAASLKFCTVGKK